MKVSVVIPTYNKAALLRRTLDSLAANRPADFEVVVASDGSSDGTAAFLTEYRGPFTLEPVLLKENRGRSGARNAALARARGDLVVFLDDDMEVVSGFIAAHHRFHENARAAGMHVAGVGNVGAIPEVFRSGIGRYMATRGAQKIGARGALPWKYFSSNNSSALRADLEAVGGFDETFRAYGFEDLELALRLEKERGVSFGFVADARSTHLETYDLDDVLRKKRVSGSHSLAHLLAKHADAARRLDYDRYLESASDADRRDSSGVRFRTRGAWRAVFSSPAYAVALLAARGLGSLAPDVLFDYLVLRNYLAGLEDPAPPAPAPSSAFRPTA